MNTSVFATSETTVRNGKEFKFIYSTKNVPLTLFSTTTGLPLLSVHFLSDTSKTVISETTNDEIKGLSQFQGLIQKDNQKIKFAITNHTQHTNICLNFLPSNRDGSKVSTTRMNEINIFKPGSTVFISSDQRADNKSIILSPGVDQKTGKKIKNKDYDGTYFFLQVVPTKYHGEIKSWTNTKWRRLGTFIDYKKYVELCFSMSTNSRGCYEKSTNSRGNNGESKNSDESIGAKITYGSQNIINSETANVKLSHENSGKPCILGLSILSTLETDEINWKYQTRLLKLGLDVFIKTYLVKNIKDCDLFKMLRS